MNKIIIILIVVAILVMCLLMYALGVFDGDGILLRDLSNTGKLTQAHAIDKFTWR